MLGTNTSFAPFVAEDDDDILDPGLVPAEDMGEKEILDEDADLSEDLPLDSDEDEEGFEEEEM